MFRALALMLPALVPSWRFFEAIAPSPRIEFARISHAGDTARDWQPLYPERARMPLLNAVGRLFYNPDGNDYLFMVSCAERLVDFPTAHSETEIVARIRRIMCDAGGYIQFRLIFVHREGEELVHSEEFRSGLHRADAG